ncbi:MAG: class I SAM-dependent methyltransferase [bacterium]
MNDDASRSPQPARREWYRDAFGEFYPLVYAHRDDGDAERAIAMAVPYLGNGRILDLACGTGRHLRALARRRHGAVGLDLSPELLREAIAQGTTAPLVRGDMRVLPFRSATFGAVLSLFSSFGYFEAANDDLAVLREIRRVLSDRGRLVLDLANPYHARRRGESTTERVAGGYTVRESRRLVEDGRRVVKCVTIVDAAGSVASEYLESLRLFEPGELDAHAAEAGLARLAWIGDYNGAAWQSDSPRLIGVFEAPGAPHAGSSAQMEETR